METIKLKEFQLLENDVYKELSEKTHFWSHCKSMKWLMRPNGPRPKHPTQSHSNGLQHPKVVIPNFSDNFSQKDWYKFGMAKNGCSEFF